MKRLCGFNIFLVLLNAAVIAVITMRCVSFHHAVFCLVVKTDLQRYLKMLINLFFKSNDFDDVLKS